MWWLILPGILITVLMILLFSRIVINVNSEQGFASVRLSRIAQVCIVLNESVHVARIRIAWWEKEFDLFKLSPMKREVNRQSSSAKKMAVGKMLRKLKGVLMSFKVSTCMVSVNTGDMALNGILFPWFYLLRLRTGRDISISFTGDTLVVLQVENSIARMLWAYIKS